jgi:EAL domain-containing protein (putative c-di-GMP-specific phosphodiesterase class I)
VTLCDILRTADAACYVAKDKGRNRIHVNTQDDKELAQRHGEISWIARIQKGLEEDRFVLYSQKILPLGAHPEQGRHHELLLRLKDEQGNLVPPMAFIPAAERYGLMPLLDRWVIRTALAHYAAQSGEPIGTCAINLSGNSICDDTFLAFVREQFSIHNVPPSCICFEITETAAIANLTQANVLIKELKEIGCRFSLDDFGSGMSSFAYLKHLPVDYLKIDGCFVKDMISDPIDRAMVESINHIGHVMGIQTIAEFVENDEILEFLRTIGVDYAQGYGVGKPQLECPAPR